MTVYRSVINYLRTWDVWLGDQIYARVMMQLIAWPIEFPRNIGGLLPDAMCWFDTLLFFPSPLPDVQSRAGSYVENPFTWPWPLQNNSVD
jgi:hypothetical protein